MLEALITGLAPVVVEAAKALSSRPKTKEEAIQVLKDLLKEEFPELKMDKELLRAIADGEE